MQKYVCMNDWEVSMHMALAAVYLEIFRWWFEGFQENSERLVGGVSKITEN